MSSTSTMIRVSPSVITVLIAVLLSPEIPGTRCGHCRAACLCCLPLGPLFFFFAGQYTTKFKEVGQHAVPERRAETQKDRTQEHSEELHANVCGGPVGLPCREAV